MYIHAVVSLRFVIVNKSCVGVGKFSFKANLEMAYIFVLYEAESIGANYSRRTS